jgi:hypothetical protein
MTATDPWNLPLGAFKRKAGRTADGKRKTTEPRGHAAAPGTGPAGQSCGTCRHLCRIKYAKTYLKCGLMKSRWTGGPGTDIRAKDAACARWEGGAA